MNRANNSSRVGEIFTSDSSTAWCEISVMALLVDQIIRSYWALSLMELNETRQGLNRRIGRISLLSRSFWNIQVQGRRKSWGCYIRMSYSDGRNSSVIPLIHAWSFEGPTITAHYITTWLFSNWRKVHIHQVVTDRCRFGYESFKRIEHSVASWRLWLRTRRLTEVRNTSR